MKRITQIVALVCCIAVSASALAGPNEGLAAFNNKDYATAFNEWMPDAKAGEPNSQFAIGMLYSKGLGVLKDEDKGAEWYLKASQQGYSNAQVRLSMYHLGKCAKGVKHDCVEMEKWMFEAAKDGNKEALGSMTKVCAFESAKSANTPEETADLAKKHDEHLKQLKMGGN